MPLTLFHPHAAPHPPRRAAWPAWRRAAAPALLSALLLVAGCGAPVVNPVTGKTERSVMSERDEAEEGRKAHAEILKETPAYPDARLQAYVNGIGQKLAAHSHRANLPWTFTVLDDPEVNAFALPGGYVYVTRGIMAYLNDEAELAGVIGHEIGHVTARHGAQRATRQQDLGIGVALGTLIGVAAEAYGFSGATQFASQLSQDYANGRIASYSREQESQADQLGAEYLARTQYNPQNMVEVIGALKDQERFAADAARAEGRAAPARDTYLSSHPSNDQRLADIRRIAAQYASQGTHYADDGRARWLQMVNGIAFGEARTQGVTRGRNFYHEDLGIALTAPQGWKVQNTPSAIVLVNGAGDAGLVVKLAPPAAGASADEVIRNLFKPSDGSVQRSSLNGLPATRFVGTARDAQGQARGVRATIVLGPANRFYVLQGGARDPAAQQRSAAGLAEAEGSFRALSAAERAAARPWTLKVVNLPRGGFAELARSSPLTTLPEAQLRLLNGAYAGGREPQPGQPVKVVQ